MQLRRLKLERFRLVEWAEFPLEKGANLFTGRNAQGKTTLLEAVHYLSSGRSFRTPRDREVLPHGEQSPVGEHFAACQGTCRDAYAAHEVRVAISPAGKTIWLDGKQLRKLTELWGRLNTVCLLPSDLDLVRGAPAVRRSFLDSLLARTRPDVLQAIGAYAIGLRNRNALLRRAHSMPDAEAEAYEQQMAEHGARTIAARQELVRGLEPLVREQMEALAPAGEHIQLHHETGLPARRGSGVEPAHGDAAALAEQLRTLWQGNRREDFQRGSTQHGPHRAEIRITLDGHDARAYASQGQARAVALSLRLAEARWLEQATGQWPVLLLDDVLGELDRQRTGYFVRLLSRPGLQSLLTATDVPDFGSKLPIAARFEVQAGRVRRA